MRGRVRAIASGGRASTRPSCGGCGRRVPWWWRRRGVWGPVAHPRDPARTVGGSSSGEAALVAAGASVLGIGSDSGGSIRLPAAWAGVCGLRPTAGRVPTTGHFPRVGPRSDGRTQIGPLAAVRRRPGAGALGDGRARTGGTRASRRCRCRRRAGSRCAGCGWPRRSGRGSGSRRTGWRRRSNGRRACWWRRARNGCRGSSRGCAPAWDVTHRYWARAGGRADLTGADVHAGAGGLGPLHLPLPGGDGRHRRGGRARHRRARAAARRRSAATAFAFLMPASLVGAPALALPAGDEDGLPISVQLVGRAWAEPVLLAAAGPSNAPVRPDRPRRRPTGRTPCAPRARIAHSPCPRSGLAVLDVTTRRQARRAR